MISKLKNKLPIILIILLSCIVYIWKLWDEGLGNLFYSAGVYSMGKSFHAFLYNSIDSVGFISIDKPPLGLWIQVLFTKIFGFNGMAILLPEALATIFSVYFIYKIVNTRFGEMAGLISALVLALTPILAAVSRNNTIDSTLIFLLVLAADQTIKAAEKSNLKHLIYANLLIGLGFNVKMLQAYMIIPGVFLTYFLFSKEKLLKRFISCSISIVILLIVSFSWIMMVDLTPISNRPYVGSSGTNSELSLTLDNNGIGRLIGKRPKNANINNMNPVPNDKVNSNTNFQTDTRPAPTDNDKNKAPKQNTPKPNPNDIKKPAGEGGVTSILRLYNNVIAGQISWFLLPALIVSLFCLYQFFKKGFKEQLNNITLFFFTMCFIPMFIYFSFSNGMVHRYYLAMLSFPIAALIGIGSSILFEKSKGNKLIPPIIWTVTALAQLYIQSLYKNWLSWILILCSIVFAITAIFIFVEIKVKFKYKIIPFSIIVLLILPGIWSFTPIIYGNNAQLPIAGPELVHQGDLFDRHPDLTNLITYLKDNRGNAAYIASAPSAMDIGAELILQSGEAVMILGGFNGGDNPLTVNEYIDMIRACKVKYAIISNSAANTGKSNQNINEWIIKYCTAVDKKFNGFTLYKLEAN